MAVRVTIHKGFDAAYPWKAMGAAEVRQPSVGYYMAPAEGGGEPPGRWWGKGAATLGLEPGSVVEREAYDLVVDRRLDPRDKVTRLGRSPQAGIARADVIYQKVLAAEPEATQGRKWALRLEAQKLARQGPLYFDLTVSLSKSISVFYASLGENLRQAQVAGDQDGAAEWAGMIAEVDEMIHAANRTGLEFFEREAGYVRTGYHGGRVNGLETGQFREAGLAVASFLQHTSRADDIQLHVHNVIAHAARTDADGKWRAPDSYAYNEVHNGVAPIVALHLESALTQRFGVAWTPRADGYGHEISGVTQQVMDALSTRRASIKQAVRERAAEFERMEGRKPSQRELAQIAQAVTLDSRDGKEEKPLDFAAVQETCADKVRREADGAELRDIAPSVWGEDTGQPAPAPGAGPEPPPAALARAVRKALVSAHEEKSAWTRHDLLKHLGWTLPAQVRQLAPADTVRLLHRLAGEALAGRYGDVRCLEAPEVVRLPERLMRADGRSVYRRHGGARYATLVQLTTEERMVARAGRALAPACEPARAAQLLGSDTRTLDAQLVLRAEAAGEAKATTGLRLDQAAALYLAFTDGRLATTLTGPAGSGKTHTLIAAGLAARDMGWPQVWGVTGAQAARNVLADAAAQAGLTMNAYNSARLLAGLDSGRLDIAPRSLIIIDEASMLPMGHLARILQLADEADCKVIVAGDQEQLAAVAGGGGMRLLARANGYVQLAEPVRFEQEWERSASLRLRAGDASVLADYDMHGRIRGGDPETVMDAAVRDAVAERLAGRDVLLLAAERERGRELARRVRDDLIHLGLVEAGPTVRLAEGQKASRLDLVIARQNDHPRGIANGDVLRIEAIDGAAVTLRKAMDRDPQTGAMVLGEHTIPRGRHDLATFDLGYCSTGHAGMGRTVATGIPVITGNEDRQWLYTAMSRGAARNTAYVMSVSPKTADPAPGPEPAPELARYDRLAAERAGLPPEPETAAKHEREPAAVLAGILARDGAAKSATEIQQAEAANADHLATLHGIWQGELDGPRTERYTQIFRDTLPAGYAAGAADSPQATWLWRTLRGVEAAGLDARQAVADAVNSRSLDGARDVAAVVDARIRQRVGSLTPQPQPSWADQVPQVADPQTQDMFRALATWMDERTERLGKHAADARPEWATAAFGEVPADPQQRAGWEQRASRVAAYRELYGYDHPADPIGPEPAAESPEQRAAWHAGLAALGPVDSPDPRGLSEGELWLRRDSYQAETAWAPKHVAEELRLIRFGAQNTRTDSVRADAEAAAAEARGQHEESLRHRAHAESARVLHAWYQQRACELEPQDAQYSEWEHLTEPSRRLAVAADAELRRRRPGQSIEPLTSAEPEPVTEPERDELLRPAAKALAEPTEPPAWVARLADARDALQQALDDRKAIRVPAEDHELQDEGEAWPSLRPRERDAILQPPPPEIPASPRLPEHAMGWEAEPEAG